MKKILYIGYYEAYGSPFADYLEKKNIKVKRFFIKKRPQKKFLSKKQIISNNIYALFKIILNIRLLLNAKVYCTGASFAILLIYRLFHIFLGKSSHLYIDNFYIHSLGNNKYIKRILCFLLHNKSLTLIVQTPNELTYYKKLSSKVHLKFIPYCSDIDDEYNAKERDDGYIFTGGYTNRDYQLIIKLAKEMPQNKFVIIASKLNKDLNIVPNNILVKRDIDEDTFSQYLASASVVIIPLKEDVGSSGQMLCIQSMRYHKPIVYTNISSISYYFTKTSGIPYRMGDLSSLKNGVEKILSNKINAKNIGEEAYRNSLNFTNISRMKILNKIIEI